MPLGLVSSSQTISPLLYKPIVGILFPTSNFLPWNFTGRSVSSERSFGIFDTPIPRLPLIIVEVSALTCRLPFASTNNF